MRNRARWSLRRRLVVGILALLAAASLIIAAVSVLSLEGFLTNRLDRQLDAATARSQEAVNRPGSVPGGGFQGEGTTSTDPNATPTPAPTPTSGTGTGTGNGTGTGTTARDLRILPGQAPLTITSFIRSGSLVNAGYIDAQGASQDLTAAQRSILLALPADGKPRTVDLGGEIGEYRVAVTTNLLVGLPLSDTYTTVYQLIAIIAGVTLLVLAIALIAGTFVVRLALRPLERVVSTATHVAELPLDRGEVAIAVRVPEIDADPRTEVGQVGAAINRMLGHVASALSSRQASENKVRQFVADASHELRTPLASIRGYAELTRRGNYELPADVVHSLGRVESEAIRMTSLVEDLLLLARLDEGRDLEKRPLDVSRLLVDAVSDAHAAGPDHEWSLDAPEEPVMIDGDEARLHQVVANLLANARVHTPAGTAVTVALSREPHSVVITIADDGPGIADDMLPVLFERFARGDSSRSRAAGSTGLGLAIVAAVVEGHRGTVTVDSEPGRTEFRVVLPLDD